MAGLRLNGPPHTACRYTNDHHGPVPTPEDRWLLIVGILQTYLRHVVQGWLFGTAQCQVHHWSHVLLGVLPVALGTLGDAPARALMTLRYLHAMQDHERKSIKIIGEIFGRDHENGTDRANRFGNK